MYVPGVAVGVITAIRMLPPRSARAEQRLIYLRVLRTIHCSRGGVDGAHNILVPGTPAQVANDRVPNVSLSRVRIVLQQLYGTDDHARRAVAALKPVISPERLLDRMQ